MKNFNEGFLIRHADSRRGRFSLRSRILILISATPGARHGGADGENKVGGVRSCCRRFTTDRREVTAGAVTITISGLAVGGLRTTDQAAPRPAPAVCIRSTARCGPSIAHRRHQAKPASPLGAAKMGAVAAVRAVGACPPRTTVYNPNRRHHRGGCPRHLPTLWPRCTTALAVSQPHLDSGMHRLRAHDV